MRSGWSDPNAAFVGIKCGRNGIAHAHQDLGSSIFYALGEKWLIDLGTERQTYLGHQHHFSKSDFYRIREEGHNTLVFNPGSKYCQDPRGLAEIKRFESSSDDVFALADLSDAYRDHAEILSRPRPAPRGYGNWWQVLPVFVEVTVDGPFLEPGDSDWGNPSLSHVPDLTHARASSLRRAGR